MCKKRNRYFVVVLLILLLVCINFAINNFKTSSKLDENSLNISSHRIEEVIKNNINKREVLKLNENILIGYSTKELENGYYDLKICNEKDSLDIHVNKVWKEFNDKLYQEEYINQIVRSIIEIFGIDNKDVYKDLYEYILEGYKMSKGLIDSNLKNKDGLKLEGIELKRSIVNNEMILSINKEVDK